MEDCSVAECSAEAMALRIGRIERLRDALPVASRALQRMAGGLSVPLLDRFDRCDEALVEQSEALRSCLAEMEPESLEGAVALMMIAERDWLSGDPQLKGRAVSMIERALRFMASCADNLMDAPLWPGDLRLLPVSLTGEV